MMPVFYVLPGIVPFAKLMQMLPVLAMLATRYITGSPASR